MATQPVKFILIADDQASPALERARALMSRMDDARSETASVMERSRRTMDDAEQSNRKFNMSLGDMDGAIQNVATAFGGLFVVQKAMETIDLGERVNDATIRFDAYTERLDANGDALERLRESTRGGATDFDLMNSAALALSVGVAKTEDEMVTLVEIGSRLGGGAAGVDALVGALKNGISSIELLDDIGISADNVKRRMQEMGQSFSEAVIAEGLAKLEQYGDALDAQVSAIDRWKVGFQNAIQGAADGIADVVNQALIAAEHIVAIVDMMDGTTAEQEAAQRASLEQSFAAGADYAARVMTMLDDMSIANGDGIVDGISLITDQDMADAEMFIENISGATLAWEQANSQTVDSIEDINAALSERAGYVVELDEEQRAMAEFFLRFLQSERLVMGENERLAIENAAAEAARIEELNTARVAWANNEIEQRRRALNFQQYTVTAMQQFTEDEMGDMRAMGARYIQQQGEIAAAAEAARQDLLFRADTGAYGAATEFFAIQQGEFGGVELFTEEQAQRFEDFRDQYMLLVEEAQMEHEGGVINDDELARVENAADEAARMADEARRGADAYADMAASLDTLLGRGGGGVAGEIGDEVMAQMEASGRYTEEQLAAFQSSLDLSTGRETLTGQAMEDQVIPILTEIMDDMGIEAYDAAVLAVQNYLQQGRLSGMSDEQLAAGLPAATGYALTAGGGQMFTVNQGDTVGGLAAQYGMSPEQIMTAAGISDPRLLQPGEYGMGGGELLPLQDFSLVAEYSTTISDEMLAVDEYATTISEKFGALTATVQVINIEPRIVDEEKWKRALFGLLEEMVVDRGGRGAGMGGVPE